MTNKAKIKESNSMPDTESEAFHAAQASHSGNGQRSPGKTRDVLSLFATAILPIMGALGTVFVFLVVNFYVGDVDVVVPTGYQSLEIRAYNHKGQETVFHTPHFQLFPDSYHFEVLVNSQPKQHADAVVKFHHTSNVLLSSGPSTDSVINAAMETANDTATSQTLEQTQSKADQRKTKRWWQVWKKGSEN
jgi:hypothetical protein